MDHKQHQITQSIYHLLINNPDVSFKKLSTSLQIDTDGIKKQLSLLKQMGLDILLNAKGVTLVNPPDIIDPDYICSKLNQAGLSIPVKYYFSTTSTNEQARQDKEDGIYITDHQSKGKGRQAKQWLTPLGQSIAMSFSHQFDFGLNQLSGLNIAIGVAIIKTTNYFKRDGLGLKWPNDVLGRNGKVAGILIEVTGNNQRCRVVIGVGINWSIRTELLDTINQPCENLNINQVSRSQFIVQLIIEINTVLLDFSHNRLVNILEDWKKHDLFKGKDINVIQGNNTTQSKYLGVNQHGCLLVETSGEIKTLASGEVSIRKVD